MHTLAIGKKASLKARRQEKKKRRPPGGGRLHISRFAVGVCSPRRAIVVFTSTDETDALLFACLSFGLGLCRQLQHGCRLVFAEKRQQYGAPIGKFERVVMRGQLLLVDLTEDGGLMIDRF